MITNFKIFENQNIDFEKLTKMYKNAFFIEPYGNSQYSWKDEKEYIVLVDKIEPHIYDSPKNHEYAPKGIISLS